MTARAAWIVFRKELVDALRDRRTLAVVVLSGVLMGPLVLVALSALVGSIEERAERRVLLVDGADRAPTLVNYLQRQSYAVRAPPADYEALLRASKLPDPVLVVPAAFEAALTRGASPRVEVVSDSSNKPSEAGASRAMQLLAGFNRERGGLALALRGVSPALLEAVDADARDLAGAGARGAQSMAMLPFFVILAVLYGALNAALDTTAGERERGSLEPLLATPPSRLALVLGKWGAVAAVATLIAVLSCASFIPAQALLRSETLQALMRYGAGEALAFVAVLLPLAAALAALLMAVAIRCSSHKEAQANATVVTLAVSLLPLAALFSQGGEAPWHLWLPALAQSTLMNRVLRGEALGVSEFLPPLAVCTAIVAASLGYVARSLRRAALQ